MKKFTYTIAAIALFAITATATYAANKTEVAKADTAQQLDCWSSQASYQNGDPASLNQQSDCPGLSAACCVKPLPGGGFQAYFRQ